MYDTDSIDGTHFEKSNKLRLTDLTEFLRIEYVSLQDAHACLVYKIQSSFSVKLACHWVHMVPKCGAMILAHLCISLAYTTWFLRQQQSVILSSSYRISI